MEIYIVTILILIFFGFFELTNFKWDKRILFLLFIVFILFVLHDGLRWETGGDWDGYKLYFEASSAFRPDGWEVGYRHLNDIVYMFSQNYTVFLLVYAIIMYSLYLKSINDYTKYPLLTTLSFYCLFIGYMGMNRQHLALAICLFAYRYIVSREFIKFFVLVIIAVSFHFSAIIFLIAYFLNRKISASFCAFAFLAAAIFNPMVEKITSPLFLALSNYDSWTINKVAKYAVSTGEGGSLFILFYGLIKRFIIFVVVYFNLDKLEKSIPSIRLMFNIYCLSIFMYILFNFNHQIFVGRGSLFFGFLFEMFLLPCLIIVFNKKDMRCFVFAIIAIFLLWNAYRSFSVPNYDPYKGIFINTKYFRIMY